MYINLYDDNYCYYYNYRDATRVVVMDNGFGIFSNSGEPSIDLVDQAGYLFGRSLAATLNSTPSPLHWWLEEAKILGLESQADVCLTVCNELIPELEVQRSVEMSKTRGKRKKKSSGDSGRNVTGGDAQADDNKERAPEAEDSGAVLLSPVVATRPNTTIAAASTAVNTTIANTITGVEIDGQGTNDGNNAGQNSQNIITIDNNFATAASYEPNENGIDNFNSEEDTDVSGDDDNSSKPEDDIDQNDDDNDDNDRCIPYIESNEEMTESDGNPLEEDLNQNGENGGGSASDSGHSIASSVSTEAFYQIAPQQNTMEQQNILENNVEYVHVDNDAGMNTF